MDGLFEVFRLVSSGLGIISAILIPWVRMLQMRMVGLQSGIARADKRNEELADRVIELQKDLYSHRLHVSDNVFKKEEVKEVISREVLPIKESTIRIEGLLLKLVERELENK